MTSKEELRESVRQRLRGLHFEEIAWKSYQLCSALQEQRVWREARIVALFASLPTEPVVEFLWDSIRQDGKKACYPKVNGRNLSIISVADPTELVASRWQLREPVMREPNLQSLEKIDLILVPGLAFSRNGERIGRGGGFYDRLLANEHLRAHRIGICFDMQVYRDLPLESHDIVMDQIATESGVFQRAMAPEESGNSPRGV